MIASQRKLKRKTLDGKGNGRLKLKKIYHFSKKAY